MIPPHLRLSLSVYRRKGLCPQAVPFKNHEVTKNITCSTQSVCSVSHTTTSANICSLQREHHRIVLTAFCDSDFLARYIRLHSMSGTSYGTMAHKVGSCFHVFHLLVSTRPYPGAFNSFTSMNQPLSIPPYNSRHQTTTTASSNINNSRKPNLTIKPPQVYNTEWYFTSAKYM